MMRLGQTPRCAMSAQGPRLRAAPAAGPACGHCGDLSAVERREPGYHRGATSRAGGPFMFTLGPTYPKTLLGRLLRVGSAVARESRPIDHLVAPFRRPLDRAWYVRTGRLRELGKLGDSVSRTPRPAGGKRVLVLSLRMWTYHT